MPFVLDITAAAEKPTYDEIVVGLLKAIKEDRLKPGDKMPSIRELAKSLAVPPTLINRSYTELASQGYIKTIHGRGAFVSERVPYILSLRPPSDLTQSAGEDPQPFPTSDYGQRLVEEKFLERTLALHSGAPLIEDLPLVRWRAQLQTAVKFEDPALLSYESDPMGYWPLRRAAADYLLRARAVRCSPAQIAVFTDVDAGTDMIVRILLRPGDAVVVEEPSYELRRTVFRLHGIDVVGVPVDGNGLQVEHLSALKNNVRLVYTLPSHHEPSGVSLSLERRQQLLAWATQRDALILENDFDSEYKYGGSYLPSIQGLSDDDRVIYRFTFWRVLYPLVRMSLLVLPKRLVPYVRRAQKFLGEAPLLEQKALAEFIASGQLEKHIQTNQVKYQSRRIALIQALTKHFGKIDYVSTGMHLVVNFPTEYLPANILKASRAAGLPLTDTTACYLNSQPHEQEFLIGFAYLSSESQITTVMDQFASRLKSLTESPVHLE